MSAIKGNTGTRARGDGLSDGEADIMALYDGGVRDRAEIAERTGCARKYVDQVIGRYAVSEQSMDAFDRMSAAGTTSLLAALYRFHPETRQGVHP